MNRVFSSKELAERIVAEHSNPDTAAQLRAVAPSKPAHPPQAAPQPIAILGVHGISPFQRYAFQDQLAEGLRGYLNAREQASKTGREWRSIVHWPEVKCEPDEPQLKPSALRLYRDDEKCPDDPKATQVYDVYEGYWSPYSKGKTNIASLLTWLVRCTFLATSSTARVPATWLKVLWDVGYVGALLVVAAALLLFAFVAGSVAWSHFTNIFSGVFSSANPLPTFEEFIRDPLGDLFSPRTLVYIQLGITIVIGYFCIQVLVLLKALLWTHARTKKLLLDANAAKKAQHQKGDFETTVDKARVFHWIALAVVLGLLGLFMKLDLIVVAHLTGDSRIVLEYSGWVVATAALVQLARAAADFVVENVLGDIQVYTTHDTNAEFYTIRGAIIDAVTGAILSPLNAIDKKRPLSKNTLGEDTFGPLYDKVHVMGHSLGSTIALDALIRLRQFVEERAIDPSVWNRVRSFTTFGTALEKTKFFFDVRHPTVSAAQDQWANDVYGRFFTTKPVDPHDPDNTKGVVYWSNHWYFQDVVANAIESYKSGVAPGAHSFVYGAAPKVRICDDVSDKPIPHSNWLWAHGDYLGDPAFWLRVGPVLTS